MTQPIEPPELRAYRDALAAYNLAAGEWLGLNTAEVFNFFVDERDSIRVTWDSTERQSPRVGHLDWGVHDDGDGGMTFTGDLTLAYVDGRDFFAAVGPKPRMFSRAQELMLKGLAAEAAERSSS